MIGPASAFKQAFRRKGGLVATQGMTSQTLARGLRLLDLLAEAPAGMTVSELASGIDVHRSIAYRLIRTLEDSGLAVRDAAGGYRLGPHLATLARGVAPDLQSAAQLELRHLADELGVTAFLVVLDRGECVTLMTVEPRAALASIAQRPGTRHSVMKGATGLAIQTLMTPADRAAHALDQREGMDVAAVRAAGFAVSAGEVIPGVTSVAAPVPGTVPAAIAVLFVARDDLAELGPRVRAAARALAASLS